MTLDTRPVVALQPIFVKRLDMLADWLIENEGKIDFDMAHYKQKHACGTSACAVGWAPEVPGLPSIDIPDGTHTFLDWNRYCERELGISCNEDAWSYMFSEVWGAVDNSASGAGKRIKYYLENGYDERAATYFINAETIFDNKSEEE